MKYPKVVQAKIDFVFDAYMPNEKLERFDIFHLYPGKLAYPTGYTDSRFFELVGYNTSKMESRKLGRHDSLRFEEEAFKPHFLRIFADGSTLIKFRVPVACRYTTQEATII